MNAIAKPHSADVVIVGGGPTGLFMSNLLGQAGIPTILLEKYSDRAIPSMAIGVMPPSLRMFESIDLAIPVVQAGCPVRTVVVHDQASPLGTLDFASLPPPYAFVLSIPQGELMRFLRARLAHWPSVRIMEGADATAVSQNADFVTVQMGRSIDGGGREVTAPYVVACDGDKSGIRDLLGIARVGGEYAVSFIMGDFPDTTTWAREAHLYFTPTGSVESFPLPGGRRRWVALADSEQRDTETLVHRIHAMTGMRLEAASEYWHSSFTPERRLAQSFFRGRVVLCGDAAHVMSPIGGQGMNTGFADVWMLAAILKRLLQTREAHEPLFANYESARRRAFNLAADRASRGMWFGTRTGRLLSAIRARIIRHVLLGRCMARYLPRYFTMLTLPGCDIRRAGAATEGGRP